MQDTFAAEDGLVFWATLPTTSSIVLMKAAVYEQFRSVPAGTVVKVGRNVRNWLVGDRVTLPFVCGCDRCPQRESDNQQVRDHQSQSELVWLTPRIR